MNTLGEPGETTKRAEPPVEKPHTSQKTHTPSLPPLGPDSRNDRQPPLSEAEFIEKTDRFMEQFSRWESMDSLPDTIFFLDKRARPLGYMFRKLFPEYCPGRKMPAIRYLNIGRKKTEGDVTYGSFSQDPHILNDVYGKYIDQQGSILIVDEFSETGRTIKHAKEVVGKAFPKAHIAATTAYDKYPTHLYKDGYYALGVEDIPRSTYEHIALSLLNDEVGSKYKTIEELEIHPLDKRRFEELLAENLDSIPYTKRGDHGRRSTTTKEFNSLSEILRTGKLFGEPKSRVIESAFLTSRMLLDQTCQQIISLHKTRQELQSQTASNQE